MTTSALTTSFVVASLTVGSMLTVAHTQVRDFKPVTEETLRNPSPADWINWRRTGDGWGYSPLNQITRANVGQLQLVWSWAMQPGADEATPLVYNGVMYLPSPSGIQAVDAATGDFIWEFKRAGVARRNLAIFGEHIFAGTTDAHLIAVNARTGRLVWDQTVADKQLGYQYTSGPIIVKGMVVAGMTGCDRYKDDVCFISAHDAQTGKERWRTATVARPGEPGGNTWGELPLTLRAGADTWIPGSYDPASNLIFWGTAQAKPWASAQRGTDGASLYTNSTLALNADTGKMVWYFQHIPAETHDLDEVFERVLVDSGDRQSVFSMGKAGILWELDRKTGRFLNAFDLGYQNVLNIDSNSGQVKYRPEVIPKLNVRVEYCPGPGGFKNLFAMSYHPETRAFYIPVKLSCATSVFAPMTSPEWARGGTGPSKRTSLPHPASPNDLGEFVAMDSRTGKILWRHRNPLPYDTAALTTAGGVAFIGDMDRYFSAFDTATGQLLWQTRTPTPPDGFPITYAVGGRQYLAVPTGPGWFVGYTHLQDVRPAFHKVEGGPAVLVFALPTSSGRL
ncbi:MAG: pyrrolo-quinoline quinone [Acidobacteria bacterium]|nr:MAG: pyrrolo-quinoline quinone [Acidobacteriota bacterium]